jgi:hypothetical protein
MSIPSTPAPDAPENLQEEVAALRSGFAFFLRLQLLFILVVGVFVWRVALVQHRSLEAARLGSSKIRNDQIRQQQIVEEFRKYASTRPEFAQLLRAKGIEVAGAPAGVSPTPARPPAAR